MKIPLTFILSLTFLFLFSGSVYGEEPEIKREYWGKGKLYKEIHFKNKKREGLTTWWYASGAKDREIHYKNGKRDGLKTGWYESGQMEFEIPFKIGARHGVQIKWSESGKIESEDYYEKGSLKEKLPLNYMSNK